MRWKTLVLAPLVALGLAIAFLLTSPAQTLAQTVIRYPIPNSNFPIAQAVEVSADATRVMLSGQVPPMVNPAAPPTSFEAFGDTKTQTVGVLERIKTILESMNLTMGDVVKMQVFLVGDPQLEGKMDFAGFMEGYTQYFGTADQPNLPVRSTMQVSGLVNPGWLVEIEVEAVRTPA